ncbi:Pkinase-domain-containing protein [Fomitiporia mediterranea MF3/22]|uniref:Pkinase-domain-containing protein n=1 Tax=Fomitiporia mediterranea (strain MF3/22) TaxID=694068 RepID=UPI0004408EAD|nr:Pkinase-domain-containing protein [Fomitiporia mediterranea MF3/22]EJD03227.1 Pkinase-domain-containing protein [Fomitiporia mediterranea MF3/22]
MSGTTASNASSPLDLYEPLEIIGNGSFGIIRKVRRKSDGEILARKELNFEKMSERDRKQIVAEVNILKDLHHENIVRYIDRFVDRDAGILYILMEYCDGGDLSSIIKQSARSGRTLPEDTVWSYFLQLLLALQHCHCPNSKDDGSSDGKRQQILHRDLKPENVFISKGSMVKLGDFGLSKALTQTSFANTYVGTPYYMSPELIQEKSYDTKSDIWSLGCLIYELCALRPPFHEAQTHSELSMLIRNGRIPPLPKGYSQSLNHIIKAMLNLNPAMRPSAQQLLQHERIDFARKVADTEKMLISVKAHKSNVIAKERELQNLSAALAQREASLSTIIEQKDAEISRLTDIVAQADERIKRAVTAREEELRVAVMRMEAKARTAMTRREEEILEAVNKREEEISTLWQKREEQLREELRSAIQWVETRQKDLAEEAERIETARLTLEKEVEAIQQYSKGQKKKAPLEEVKNLITPYRRVAFEEPDEYENTPRKYALSDMETPSANPHHFRDLDTPLPVKNGTCQELSIAVLGSAMRGVVLTATGEALKTPAPFAPARAGLTRIVKNTPAVPLKFSKCFDFSESEDSDDGPEPDNDDDDAYTAETVVTTTTRSGSASDHGAAELNSPTKNVKARNRPRQSGEGATATASSSSGSLSARTRATARRPSSSKPRTSAVPCALKQSPQKVAVKRVSQVAQTKIRRPSTRPSNGRPSLPKSASTPALSTVAVPSSTSAAAKKVLPLPPTPHYDPSDEENFPSPFLRRVERAKMTRVSGAGISAGTRRKSAQILLRAKAAANAVKDTHANNAVSAPVTTAAGVKAS